MGRSNTFSLDPTELQDGNRKLQTEVRRLINPARLRKGAGAAAA